MAHPEITDQDFTDNVQAAVERTSEARSVRDEIDGRMYSAGHLFTGVVDDGEAGIIFENPVDSGVYAFIRGFYSAEAKAYVRKIDSVTKDSAGTSITSHNRRIADGTSSANIEHGPTVSGGNEWSQKVIGTTTSGEAGIPLSPGQVAGFGIILEEGENVYYQAINKSGGAQDISIDIDYTLASVDEIPGL